MSTMVLLRIEQRGLNNVNGWCTKLGQFCSLQEKPTSCGTKDADVPDKFLTGKHNANPLNILVHLQLPCAQRGMEFELCWWVESSSKQFKAHP